MVPLLAACIIWTAADSRLHGKEPPPIWLKLLIIFVLPLGLLWGTIRSRGAGRGIAAFLVFVGGYVVAQVFGFLAGSAVSGLI
ncbi:hypothetical protein B5C34_11185 [Pacificimonas flava]|uniref:Uncharacterized protein n=2 Tax=Pacificimonas TaxID=1960290 RepID=A0A219B853_9SPHN|nr:MULTISPECIES: hypothetical protein [Pacificimonas]MBZ6378768.1 hypothetical protein [Pacificimonas aurantium]OWV33969.1 hypothetical protein B5C34_11185 [Pacificimonas flava]